MSEATKQQMFDKLRGFNTPSVGNVVASYPQHPHCLGLYDPWYGRWYTDDSLTCLLPEAGPVIGYAVTVVFGLDDPLQPAVPYLDFVDFLLEAILDRSGPHARTIMHEHVLAFQREILTAFSRR